MLQLKKINWVHLVYQLHHNKLVIAVETQQNIGGERADCKYLTYVRRNSFKNWAQARGLWLIEKKNKHYMKLSQPKAYLEKNLLIFLGIDHKQK